MRRGRFLKNCICFLICVTLLTGCGSSQSKVIFDLGLGGSTVFTIGGQTCKEPEARIYLANLKNLYGYIDGQSLWSENGNFVLEKAVKTIALEELKRVYVLCAYAKANDVKLSAEEEAACKDAASSYYSSLSSADRKFLKTSKKKLVAIYERYLLAQKAYESIMASVDTDISEDECRVIRANVIFVTDYETAQTIHSAIVNKEQTFQLLSASYSEAPSYEVHVTRGMYSEDVENVVFGLDDAEISDVIAADGGYYFFRCISKYDEELSADYAKQLIKDRKTAALAQVNAYISENYDNVMNTKGWDKIEVDYDPEIVTYNFFLTLSEIML